MTHFNFQSNRGPDHKRLITWLSFGASYPGYLSGISHAQTAVTLAPVPQLQLVPLSTRMPEIKKRMSLRTSSPFSARIFQIVLMTSHKQMIGTNTTRVVAFVADLRSFWNIAEMEQPRGAWREQPFMLLSAYSRQSHDAVAFTVHSCNPQPTVFAFLNLRPKTLRQCELRTFSMPDTLKTAIVAGSSRDGMKTLAAS